MQTDVDLNSAYKWIPTESRIGGHVEELELRTLIIKVCLTHKQMSYVKV